MSHPFKYFSVNWIDGMKINKDHFISQDNAVTELIHHSISAGLTPHTFGILSPSVNGDDTFSVSLSADNQNSLQVTVLHCTAITPSGALISIPTLPIENRNGTVSANFSVAVAEPSEQYVVLLVHPHNKLPCGDPDLNENPPRFPFTQPVYTIELADEGKYAQFSSNPYALTIGRLTTDGNSCQIDEFYIPPCCTVGAHPDLLQLQSELDTFLSTLEQKATIIVQKIFKRNQQSELSDLVMFLCDRIMLSVASTITEFRKQISYEPPVRLFTSISILARVIKNTIDLRIGSGKEQLLNYLSEWCELNQGELETLLTSVANLPYNHNNINESIPSVVKFATVIRKLFETLSDLEFIGKRKDSGGDFFVKEDVNTFQQSVAPQKPKRTFFGGTSK